MTLENQPYRSPRDLFDSAAEYYARYQLGYPAAMLNLLRHQFLKNPDRDRLLDLGCGTGQLAVPLSRYASDVVAVDPNRDMLEQAKLFGEAQAATNIAYVEARSEDIAPEHGRFALATIAGAFHWMDRAHVLTVLDRHIDEEGAVAVVLPRRRIHCAPEGWWEAQLDFTRTFWGGHFPAGKSDRSPLLETSDREMLLASPFNVVEEIEFPYEHRWTLDDFMGYAFSTSKANPNVLGARRQEFEAGLRGHLAAMSPSEDFVERGRVVLLLASRGRQG
ncbi:methyltransferase domain-containing protein [Agrobacterium rhizogenes]|uniref:class I SAM-dependent methyltransferase n=1 Tax=Rhizobium rhizogenes TaxID=359 RepID=UPI0022B69B44|nr:class I SAM-dependent methyltransferase [Rhizobium rhizogenes]MCZ7450277.1 methyltransferase domain-containing protein [Rhizobium rhizogenes]